MLLLNSLASYFLTASAGCVVCTCAQDVCITAALLGCTVFLTINATPLRKAYLNEFHLHVATTLVT